MKKLYHLLTRLCKGVARNAPTSYLKPLTAYLTPLTAYLFCFLPFSAFAQEQATITNVDFSCPGIVTVTYDLSLPNNCSPPAPVSVTLYYSADTVIWVKAQTVSGALNNQTTGTGKTIVWDADEDDASFGIFYFKVEYSLPPSPEAVPILINGVKWASANLDGGGRFCANPEDYGALYQWGRVADGHECITSPCWPLSSDCGSSASPSGVVSLNPGEQQVPCPAAPCGYFIRPMSNSSPYDWRTPQVNNLWNSGTETAPKKTANDPCPNGWRIPTRTELESLGIPFSNQYPVAKVITTQNGIDGFLVTDMVTNNTLFFPFTGSRTYYTGALFMRNGYGYYWGSTTIGTNASNLNMLYTGNFNVGPSGSNRADGHAIRCVLEN